MLTTFPNTAVSDPPAESWHDSHPEALRRAIAFIEANPDVDMTVGDIARAARVSVRSLQLAFRRHLGMTPMTYVRQVRLACARSQLLSPLPGDTVARIAGRWGYLRPSRFAAEYHRTYGEHPSTTLLCSR